MRPRPPDWHKTIEDLFAILLDAERHHVQLAIVTFPDSRLYLMKVFLVPRFPYPDLHTDARYTLPRIVVRFPGMRRSWHPKRLEAFQRGVEAAGARTVKIRP